MVTSIRNPRWLALLAGLVVMAVTVVAAVGWRALRPADAESTPATVREPSDASSMPAEKPRPADPLPRDQSMPGAPGPDNTITTMPTNGR